MSKLEKLLQKLLNDPPELSYEDVYYILNAFGFEEISIKGSHHTFRNSQKLKITVPKKGDKVVKRIYLKQIVKLLNLER